MMIQDYVRGRLISSYTRVQPQKPQTKGIRLEVWESATSRQIGVEFGQETVGFWIKKMHLHGIEIPARVNRKEKEPAGAGKWKGVGTDTKGANSNLTSYPSFSGKLSHLLFHHSEDALMILDALGRPKAG